MIITKAGIVISFFIFFQLFVIIEAQGKSTVWRDGLAIIDGVPRYLDANKMYYPRLIKSRRAIINSQVPIITSGILQMCIDEGGNELWVYSIDKSKGFYWQVIESKVIYYYKVKNNVMLISKDKKSWHEIKISIVDEKPKHKDTIMIIYLKCKFFSGEYDISTH